MWVQLDRKIGLSESLAVAATALVGQSALAEDNDADWQYSASLLAYSEPDRVSATELIINATKQYDASEKLSVKIVLDSLTGASANGAIAQDSIQTFTRASGIGQYTINQTETPLDDTFRDTRLQLNLGWENALDEDTNYTLGGNFSREYDYDSISFSAEIARSFNQNNSVISAGISLAAENSRPEGGIPLGLSSMVIDSGQFSTEEDYWSAYDATRLKDSDTISSAEFLFGWTQVVSRTTLMQLNYGFASTSGYLTDPFKILSLVNANGVTQDYLHENRPDTKQQHSVFALIKHHLEESIFDVSYRYQSNDWGIDSHTIDAHWHFFTRDNSFWEPHIRYYQQSAADFYSPFLQQDSPLNRHASADYRIGEMTGLTIGLKYGFQMENSDRAEIRLEYYKQTSHSTNQPVSVDLGSLDIYPKVDALILQLNYFY